MFSSRSHNLDHMHFSLAQLFPDNVESEHGSVSLLGYFLLTTSGKLVKHEILILLICINLYHSKSKPCPRFVLGAIALSFSKRLKAIEFKCIKYQRKCLVKILYLLWHYCLTCLTGGRHDCDVKSGNSGNNISASVSDQKLWPDLAFKWFFSESGVRVSKLPTRQDHSIRP